MIVEELFSSVGYKNFEKDYLFRQPCAAPSAALKFRRLIGWELFLEILESNHPDCWLANKGKLIENPALQTGRLSFGSARENFDHGYTLLVRHAENANPELHRIAQDFFKVFQKPVDIQLYATPAGEQGFSWHYDLEDVFVIQSRGEKEFRLRRNQNPKPDAFVGGQMFTPVPDEPEIRCHLFPGDALYIPSGFWHCANAVTPSFHLSVGVLFR